MVDPKAHRTAAEAICFEGRLYRQCEDSRQASVRSVDLDGDRVGAEVIAADVQRDQALQAENSIRIEILVVGGFGKVAREYRTFGHAVQRIKYDSSTPVH